MATKEKLIAFVIYPGIPPLDLVGTNYPLAYLRSIGGRTVVVAESMEPVVTDTPLRIVPDKTFAEVPDPYGIVVMGGSPASRQAMEKEFVKTYLRAASESAAFVAAVGEGSLLLAAAGLLKNRQATTHWAYADVLKNLGVEYTRSRFVEDGKFFTAAGVTAGIDMALYLVSKYAGEDQARFAQLWAEYDPHLPLGGIDWKKLDVNALQPLFLTAMDDHSPEQERAFASHSQ